MQTDEFIKRMETGILIDVRSPKEFKQGHIPGAINMPLLEDDERSEIGTLYTKQSAETAILRGLELVGPKLASFYKKIQALQFHKEKKAIGVYCWRGGVRSNNMAALIRMWGYDVFVLEGGYKAYRKSMEDLLTHHSWNFRLLGGFTGCGKTDVLRQLVSLNEQVIDLEALANHKGSAFGHLGMSEQPSSEMFENNIHAILRTMNPEKPVWVEAESCRIGHVQIPDLFFNRMKQAPLYFYEIPYEKRIDRLCREYGSYAKPDLIDAFCKIMRRLGGDRTQDAIRAIESGQLKDAVSIALAYYDRSYEKSLSDQGNPAVYKISMHDDDPKGGAHRLVSFQN